MTGFEGKTVLVTGGNRGLGLGFAERFASQLARVAIMGRDEKALKAGAEMLRAVPGVAEVSTHVGTVTAEADIERVLDEVIEIHGRLDAVVNNAGIADEAWFMDITLDGWNRVIATNLTGPFLMTQRAARRMDNGGAIVNITSVDAHAADGPYASYVAAKAGLIGLTKASATELAQLNIRVNTVSPGWTLTQMAEESIRPDVLDRMKSNFSRVPMRRMVTVPEVAAAVAFLASDDSSGITGTEIIVDGGTLANLYILETLEMDGS